MLIAEYEKAEKLHDTLTTLANHSARTVEFLIKIEKEKKPAGIFNFTISNLWKKSEDKDDKDKSSKDIPSSTSTPEPTFGGMKKGFLQ